MNYLLTGATTERLIFRKLRQDDYEALLPHFLDPGSIRYLGTYKGSSEERCKQLIDTILNRYERGNGLMALEEKEDNRLIGLCGLLIQELEGEEVIEIGYHILPAERRKGYATEAAIKCKAYAFGHDLTSFLVSIIHRENGNSEKVALNNGMQLLRETVWRELPVKVYGVSRH